MNMKFQAKFTSYTSFACKFFILVNVLLQFSYKTKFSDALYSRKNSFTFIATLYAYLPFGNWHETSLNKFQNKFSAESRS